MGFDFFPVGIVRTQIQISSNYKMRRAIFEPTPLIAKMGSSRSPKFGMDSPYGIIFWATKVIF